MDYQLGRLEKVSLRDIWKNEALDFTPWLAQESNLAELSRTIHLDLELESTEKEVGPFRADILCRDTITDNWVLIENQLERTDHRHLGQLITYAAGLDAVTIVWIAERFTEEHRAALDWLNRISGSGINIFGLEVELWRIDGSRAAPKFNIISKPNDWTKAVATARQSADNELTETKSLHLKYWTQFRETIDSANGNIQVRKPRAQHWQHFAIGRTGFRLSAQTGMRDGYLVVQLEMYDNDSKAYFSLLLDDKEAIEAEYGQPLDWRELPDKKQSQITILRSGVDPLLEDHWRDYQNWHLTHLEKFYQVFANRIRNLDAADYVPIDDDNADEI